MSVTVPVMNEPALGRSQKCVWLKFPFVVATGSAVADVSYLDVSDAPRHLVEASSGTLITLTQANIDALLGSTNEVVASAMFGSTAMAANNAVGGVIDFGGQLAHVDSVRVAATKTAGGSATTQLGKGTKTALTDVAITDPQVYVTSSGNLAFRLAQTGLASGTSVGHILLEVQAYLK